jgi:hypothetical protein
MQRIRVSCPIFYEAATMTEPSARPPDSHSDAGTPPGEPLAVPVEAETAVQQLREAGFSEDQQAALTTALLRVLALWTQQATRADLHAEQQAMEQHVAQQLDTLREDIRREVVQHADALRGAFAQYADRIHTTPPQRPHWRDVSMWLITALLVLTSVGVMMLVVHSFGGS